MCLKNKNFELHPTGYILTRWVQLLKKSVKYFLIIKPTSIAFAFENKGV